VSVYNREARIVTGDHLSIIAGGDVIIQALGKDVSIHCDAGRFGLRLGSAISGTIPVIVATSKIEAIIGKRGY
jgi:hypothetical protein